MIASNPLDILLAHDHWATRQILDACAKLTPEQFHRRFEMGPGSLHDTVTHMLAAMRVWADLLAGKSHPGKIEKEKEKEKEKKEGKGFLGRWGR